MKNNVDAHFVQELLSQYVETGDDIVSQAMWYCLQSGGKRIRPVLLLNTAQAVAGEISTNAKLLAVSLELIHTYSLVHDDLPCMDDDDFRRGKPSCHKKYGQAVAVLVGDALLNKAVEVALSGDFCDDNYLQACRYLFACSGIDGMVFGQTLDLFDGNSTLDELNKVANYKTAGLLRASLVCGAYCGGASDSDVKTLTQIATNIGICYQVTDDLLDCNKQEKSFLQALDSDGCKKYATKLCVDAKELCKSLSFNSEYLMQFADFCLNRNV